MLIQEATGAAVGVYRGARLLTIQASSLGHRLAH